LEFINHILGTVHSQTASEKNKTMPLKERKIYPKWKATARGGRLYFEREAEFNNHLIPYDQKELQVVVKPYSKSRSRQEEKFYHAVVVRLIAGEMELTDNEVHEFLKSLFLTTEERSTSGKFRYHRTLSTTELNDKAYREYWEQCIRWAALPTKPSGLSQDSGLSLYIPYPREVSYKDW